MSGKHVAIIVYLHRPDGASDEAVREYVEEAVKSWAGSLRPAGADPDGVHHPGDPMYDLDPDSVRARL